MNTQALESIWKEVHNTPGWLVGLEKHLDRGDIGYLADLDDWWIAAGRDLRSQWAENRRERPQVDQEWAQERRKAFLEARIADNRTALVDARLRMGRAARKGDEVEECMARTDETALVEQLNADLKTFYARSAPKEDGITDEMVERARAFPIAKLLEAKKNQIACPFHTDKHPSASIARGFFWCFSCSKNLDSIGWLMEVEGLSFPDAVRKLAARS